MDYTNPSIEEIKNWAYSNEKWPHDEWDLFLSWTRELDLFIELATDQKCPKKVFFLHMLYYIVGTTFSEPTKTDKLNRIESYANKGRNSKHDDIKKWVSEVDLLLKGRKKYTYENWRGGLFADYKFT